MLNIIRICYTYLVASISKQFKNYKPIFVWLSILTYFFLLKICNRVIFKFSTPPCDMSECIVNFVGKSPCERLRRN